MNLICKLRGHDWEYCTCKRCKAKRESDHHFQQLSHCREVCSKCGLERTVHDWENITSCLFVCKKCNDVEIRHQVGKLVDTNYDSFSDYYNDDYVCSRCGRKFRSFRFTDVKIGDEFALGTACILDPRDTEDFDRYISEQ